MKVILRGYGIRMNAEERQNARYQAEDMIRARGTGRTPLPIRDLSIQSAPRGILMNWRMASGFNGDVSGFRIYKDDEANLFLEIRDANTRQHFIDCSSGTTPPVTNVFVSAINKLGIEGPKVQGQGSALAETGAPQFPGSPQTYGQEFGGGGGDPRGGGGRVQTQ